MCKFDPWQTQKPPRHDTAVFKVTICVKVTREGLQIRFLSDYSFHLASKTTAQPWSRTGIKDLGVSLAPKPPLRVHVNFKKCFWGPQAPSALKLPILNSYGPSSSRANIISKADVVCQQHFTVGKTKFPVRTLSFAAHLAIILNFLVATVTDHLDHIGADDLALNVCIHMIKKHDTAHEHKHIHTHTHTSIHRQNQQLPVDNRVHRSKIVSAIYDDDEIIKQNTAFMQDP